MTEAEAHKDSGASELIRERMAADRDQGGLQAISEYAALFPGQDTLVAMEFVAAAVGQASGGDGALPQIMGRYVIIREIGRGGQACVYLAEDLRLKRQVALKVLLGGARADGTSAARFRREAEVTSRLDHPGICPIYDFGVERDLQYIAMRHVDGDTMAAHLARRRGGGTLTDSTWVNLESTVSTLGDFVQDRPRAAPATGLTRAEIAAAVGIIERVARALHVAHEAGIIHRDIKPANIMLARDGQPVILDFGLAQEVEGEGMTLTRSGDAVGTPAYMSPEQLAARWTALDRRTDVYSLGATLYECVALTRPFEAPTREALYQAIVAQDAPDPTRIAPTVSRDLAIVIAMAMEKDRSRRYLTALEFAEDLRRVLAHEPIHARAVHPLTRARRFAQRNPVVVVSALILLLGLAAALFVSLNFLGETRDALAERRRKVVEFESLSDVKRVRDLVREATTLWPAEPDRAGDIRSWLRRAEQVAGQLGAHEAELQALRTKSLPAALAAASRAAATQPAQAPASFDRTEEQWQFEYLTELVAELRAFIDPDPHRGVLADVRERLLTAGTIEQRTLTDQAELWRRAVASIANRAECPLYAGLQLRPQIGLIPIGREPESTLWEFAVAGTGDVAPRTGAAAITLVLLPGGAFTMGFADPDPGRKAGEAPHRVALKPFFMGKTELSQAQWARVTGVNPSTVTAADFPFVTPDCPITDVSWPDCDAFTRRLGLQLPTEAQWEYACRGGSETRYAWGEDEACLEGRANVGDQSLAQFVGEARARVLKAAPWRDGYPLLAPADALATNAFGLKGLHGNVSEWCRDGYVDAIWPDDDVPGDGLRAADGATRVFRDMSYLLPPSHAGAAERNHADPGSRIRTLGLRVARAVR